jgi:hypothetical protein
MNMMPLKEGVTIQFVANQIDKETGVFEPIDSHTSSAGAMLDALVQWEKAMHQLRVPAAVAD